MYHQVYTKWIKCDWLWKNVIAIKYEKIEEGMLWEKVVLLHIDNLF
jgi:hypothetical protein